MSNYYGVPKSFTPKKGEDDVFTNWDRQMLNSVYDKAQKANDKHQFKSIANDEEMFGEISLEPSNTMGDKTYEQRMLEEFVAASIALNPEIFGNALDINTKQYNMCLQDNIDKILKLPETLVEGFQEQQNDTAIDGTQPNKNDGKTDEQQEQKPTNSAEGKDPNKKEGTEKSEQTSDNPNNSSEIKQPTPNPKEQTAAEVAAESAKAVQTKETFENNRSRMEGKAQGMSSKQSDFTITNNNQNVSVRVYQPEGVKNSLGKVVSNIQRATIYDNNTGQNAVLTKSGGQVNMEDSIKMYYANAKPDANGRIALPNNRDVQG